MPGATISRRQLVRAAMDAPYLGREEELELARKWRETGDQPALDRLASAHMRLVIALAAKFRNFGLPMNDLIQEGHVGLLEAASRFEPERNVRFSTYATWWIRASIQDYILRNWSIVRGGTSSTQKALFFNLRRLRARLTRDSVSSTMTSDMMSEVATAVGVSKADVELMNSRLSGPDTSLNAPVMETEGTSADRQDFLICEQPLQDETVGDFIDTERRSRWLKNALQELSERELRIVRERRLTDEGATLESLGSALGISKERVRQIENRALEKLRTALLRDHPDRAAFN
ncbi:RNA polymerase factor sigma-32 [Amorphus orientalis]|uniref:RNA polymerase sigma-32 factor n=1 Tax=Amorphus orientalis TaxID=649198 RepID=A0AAE3VKW8_9HYPH|nr:RNA polymerase factor sigma-32 [Amorphus orientalis]MDQ0313808.1 RNA polymerase sigma-32 factor [Amorphus orientalis]